jgi:glycosyltransferase involved in cell wall biosynthesis
LEQTYKNLELVIIGDHCTDDTESRISKIKDPRVRFYNIPKRGWRYPETAENHWLAGPVVAANTGLSMTKGKWIARIDDDDTWSPDHIEDLLKVAQKGNYEFVSAQCVEEHHGVKRTDTGIKALDPYYTRKSVPAPDDCSRIGGTQTWLYRSYLKFFKYNINCWRKNWNRVNDIDLSQRIFCAGVRMGFLDKVVAYILPRPGESTVGLEAYQLQEKDKLEHFKFQ